MIDVSGRASKIYSWTYPSIATWLNIWKFSDVKKNLNEDKSEAIHFLPEIVFVHNRCTKCKSSDFEIISGRGVSVKSILGVK